MRGTNEGTKPIYANLRTIDDGKGGEVMKFELYDSYTKEKSYGDYLQGNITNVEIVEAKITPREGKNAGREIDIKDIVITFDDDSVIKFKVGLITMFGRSILNAFAGTEDLTNIKLSVGKNKSSGYWGLYITNENIKGDYMEKRLTWKYDLDFVNKHTKEFTVNGSKVKDYTEITDILLNDLETVQKRLEKKKLGTTAEDMFVEAPVEKTIGEAIKEKNTVDEETSDFPF